jgi:hypothetical protein
MGIGAVALVLAAFGMWRIGRSPAAVAHPAVATVVAIAPAEGHFHVDRNSVSVRNSDGSGQFSIVDAELHCKVGDRVQVQQQGATLTRLPGTCR